MRGDVQAGITTTILPQSVTSPRHRFAVTPTFLSAGSRNFPASQSDRLEPRPHSPAGKPALREPLGTVHEIRSSGGGIVFGSPKLGVPSGKRLSRSRKSGFPPEPVILARENTMSRWKSDYLLCERRSFRRQPDFWLPKAGFPNGNRLFASKNHGFIACGETENRRNGETATNG